MSDSHVEGLQAENQRLQDVIDDHHTEFLQIDSILAEAFSDVEFLTDAGYRATRLSRALSDIRRIVRPAGGG
jgi:hypothetical protein